MIGNPSTSSRIYIANQKVFIINRIAIVGATGTIGSHCARRLNKEGRSLLLLGRSADKLEALSSELRQPFEALDVTSSHELGVCLQRTAADYGAIQGFVNCVGSLILKPAHLTSDDEFEQTLRTNLFSSFALLKAAVPLLRDHGGSLIFFASAAADIGIANHEAISAAKAGIIGMARSAAATYAPQNIRVNVLSPGLVKTGLTKRIWDVPANAVASTQMHALKRLGEPEQIASLVSWILHPENDWITGQVIGIDGGLSKVLPRS